MRDKKQHDGRRKVFSKAFTPSALQAYEKRVNVHCAEFIKQMRRLSGKPFDATNWMKYFGKPRHNPPGNIFTTNSTQLLMLWATWVWVKNST